MNKKRSQYLFVQFIITRHRDHVKDLESRFYTMKAIQKKLGKFIVPLDKSIHREMPIDYTGTFIDIDEADLTRFKLQFMLLVGKKNNNSVETLRNLISECGNEIKRLNKGRTVIGYVSETFFE